MLDRIVSTNVNQQVGKSLVNDGSLDSKVEVEIKRLDAKELRPLNPNEKEKVVKTVEGLNEFLSPSHTSLKFVFHEKLNEYYVTLVDDKTNEVVKEIPSKKMLDFYAAMTEAIGLMIDKKI